jgi:hypothetical protein
MKVYFENDEKAFLKMCRLIGKVIEENEKFRRFK